MPTDYISVSYDDFFERTRSSFNLLNSIQGENIVRVFPHLAFCDVDANRCIAHDSDEIFYADDNHPSKIGADVINDLIIRNINELKIGGN